MSKLQLPLDFIIVVFIILLCVSFGIIDDRTHQNENDIKQLKTEINKMQYALELQPDTLIINVSPQIILQK